MLRPQQGMTTTAATTTTAHNIVRVSMAPSPFGPVFATLMSNNKHQKQHPIYINWALFLIFISS
jgi:hypothetical protein